MGNRATRVVAGLISWSLTLILLSLVATVVLVPRLTDGAALNVLSGSMRPTIPVGALVIVVPTDPDDLIVGDIITYQKEKGESELVTHRIVEVQREGTSLAFVTKGDDNDQRDVAPVAAGAVRGEVWAVIPLAGFLSTLLKTPGGQLLLLGGLLLVWTLSSVLTHVTRLRRSDRTRHRLVDPEIAAPPHESTIVSSSGG